MDRAARSGFRGTKHHFCCFERTKIRGRIEEVFLNPLRMTKATHGDVPSPRAVIRRNAQRFERGIDARNEGTRVHLTARQTGPDHVRFLRVRETTQSPDRDRTPRVRGAHRVDCRCDRPGVANSAEHLQGQMKVLFRDRDQMGERPRGRGETAAQVFGNRDREERSHGRPATARPTGAQ
jgi:hypothetical protein